MIILQKPIELNKRTWNNQLNHTTSSLIHTHQQQIKIQTTKKDTRKISVKDSFQLVCACVWVVVFVFVFVSHTKTNEKVFEKANRKKT